MTYEQAMAYLERIPESGDAFSLNALRSLLEELLNPQDHMQFIHIAGTNGKGSVLAYTSTILSQAGYRTGRYVSPTVVTYLERIQVDGVMISKAAFASAIGQVERAAVSMEARGETGPTVFEAETAAAFIYFKEMQCDVVVLETGLGGILDATNVVKNTVVAAFTSISMDHMGILGNTLRDIGRNKAGIIKKGCSVVTALQRPEVMEILENKAEKEGCPMHVLYPDKAEILEESWSEQRFSYEGWENLNIPLLGRHQVVNAITVIGIVEALGDAGYYISECAVRKGFAHTSWPGRFSCICKEPLFVVDGAHNEEAAQRLRDSVERYFQGRRVILIMGIFKDKEYRKITEIMAPLAERIYTVTLPNQGRALDAQRLSEVAKPYCRQTQAMSSIGEAVEAAIASSREEDVVLAFGSLSYLGEVMSLVKEL